MTINRNSPMLAQAAVDFFARDDVAPVSLDILWRIDAMIARTNVVSLRDLLQLLDGVGTYAEFVEKVGKERTIDFGPKSFTRLIEVLETGGITLPIDSELLESELAAAE